MIGLEKLWRDKHMSIDTQKRIVRMLIFPTVLYGCETWTMTNKMEKKINACEMWIWRKMQRISWTEKKTNESVRMEIGIEEDETLQLDRRVVLHNAMASLLDCPMIDRGLNHARAEICIVISAPPEPGVTLSELTSVHQMHTVGGKIRRRGREPATRPHMRGLENEGTITSYPWLPQN